MDLGRLSAAAPRPPDPTRAFGVWGALLGGLGVAAGAFAAHALRTRIAPEALQVFETAARYQVYHAVALLVVALHARTLPARGWSWTGWLFVWGTCIFSGSLYGVALFDIRWLGAVTPVGGAALLAGWGCCIWTWARQV
ncbi:MAG TPA: DUF423 domain-containing protein [Gemmatimonadales bacterium]|jgi:uncharacterized membrane protein YgdD (TMEM256/DUF423 family)